MGSRDMNLIMLSYLDIQFREKRMHNLLIQIEILSSACVLNLEFMGITKEERPNRPSLAS